MRHHGISHKVRAGTKLRKLLREEQPIPTIWGGTAHHAQLAEVTGFKAFAISGSNTSTHILGMPDAGLLTMSELVENVRRICRSVDIPVIVDCDTGYGNAVNVRRTVEEVILAGAGALFIEDQVSPKRCGFVKGKEVIPVEEAAGKYRAACELRDEIDPDFVIIARSDSRGAFGGSVEEVIKRGRAYFEAGVDIFYAEALQNREEIRQVREAMPAGSTFMVLPFSIDPPLTRQEVTDLGICISSAFVAKVGSVAMYNFLRDFAKRGEDAWNEFTESSENHPMGGFGAFDLTGFPELTEIENRYLPKDRLDKYEGTIGAYDPRNRPSLKP